MNKMQATSLSSQPFQKGIEFMWTQLNIAQRTNPAAEIIGIPNIRLYTAIDACGRRRSEIANFNTLDCYIYPGSTEEYWGRQDAAQAIALVSPIPPSLLRYTSLLARPDKSVSLLGCQDHISCRVSKQILYNQIFTFSMVHCPQLTIKQHG